MSTEVDRQNDNETSQTPISATGGTNQDGNMSSRARPWRVQSRDTYIDLALLVAIGLMFLIFGLASGGKEFLGTNLVDIFDSGAILGVLTIGEAIVMISGHLDISVASTAGLVTAVMAEVMLHQGGNLWIGLVVAIVVGLVAGLFNGLVVAYGRINSVIATLGTYTAFLGAALLVTNGVQVGVVSSFLDSLGTDNAGPIPYLVLILIVLAVLGIVGMRHTLAGQHVYAVGGNQTAAKLSGIRTQRHIVTVFVISGLFAGIAGIMLVAQTGTAQPTEGSTSIALTAITAVLLGGIGLFGGTGTVLGAMLGVILLSTLDNGLLLLGVPSFWEEVATGALLLIAVLLQDFPGHRERVRRMWSARKRAATRRRILSDAISEKAS